MNLEKNVQTSFLVNVYEQVSINVHQIPFMIPYLAKPEKDPQCKHCRLNHSFWPLIVTKIFWIHLKEILRQIHPVVSSLNCEKVGRVRGNEKVYWCKCLWLLFVRCSTVGGEKICPKMNPVPQARLTKFIHISQS